MQNLSQTGRVNIRFRALYVIQVEFGLLLFHAFQKRGRKTSEREKRTARQRLGAFLKELGEKP